MTLELDYGTLFVAASFAAVVFGAIKINKSKTQDSTIKAQSATIVAHRAQIDIDAVTIKRLNGEVEVLKDGLVGRIVDGVLEGLS